jgi:hypothetical protein
MPSYERYATLYIACGPTDSQARRLGLMVPGIPGYISMRERQNMKWTKADGTQNPDWWEIDGKRDTDLLEKVENAGQAQTEDLDDYEIVSIPTFTYWKLADGQRPLAIIPRTHAAPPVEEPMPQSDLPFFPSHLAYRATAMAPQPARYNIINDEVLEQLHGEDVEIITVIRMPVRESQREVEEGEEIIREWGGVELGIARMEVVNRDRN